MVEWRNTIWTTFFSKKITMKYNFQTPKEVLTTIINSKFNRNLASMIGMAYIFEESEDIFFNEKSFDGLSFLFDFFTVRQFELSDNDFREIMIELLNLNERLNVIEVKKIIYQNQLKILKDKFDEKLISKEIYEKLVNKILVE